MRSLEARTDAAMKFELREVRVSREISRGALVRLLAEQAEYGHWELARLVLYPDGHRRVWLRRRIMKVARTA
ncbi:MAG TPA: hypothetical protein DHW34_05795 [Actinobacteria bacterium]|nr:hypothetical protein [Actinomycetota bacterium]